MSTETEEAVDQDAMAEEWAAAMEEQDASDSDIGDEGFQQVSAKQLKETPNPDSGDVKLDVILDIPVTVAMEIGRTQLSIRNLLQLNQGSIVELDRLAGEPMDVLVNGTLVAHGEVVVVNEKFGIRLTDVISPADRIKNLR
ncbi:MAG: flagellar motor switch protein FliN [Gammaproteobacteria bacterium]|nr:flagellar motor switch protein FliN [Gammaproteobacteria bacterium]